MEHVTLYVCFNLHVDDFLFTCSYYYDNTLNHLSTSRYLATSLSIIWAYTTDKLFGKNLLQLDLLDLYLIECTIMGMYWDLAGYAKSWERTVICWI